MSTAEMAKKTGQKTSTLARFRAKLLDSRYRQIGISAVAAAARYQGAAKNPAYAPSPTNWHDRAGERRLSRAQIRMSAGFDRRKGDAEVPFFI